MTDQSPGRMPAWPPPVWPLPLPLVWRLLLLPAWPPPLPVWPPLLPVWQLLPLLPVWPPPLPPPVWLLPPPPGMPVLRFAAHYSDRPKSLPMSDRSPVPVLLPGSYHRCPTAPVLLPELPRCLPPGQMLPEAPLRHLPVPLPPEPLRRRFPDRLSPAQPHSPLPTQSPARHFENPAAILSHSLPALHLPNPAFPEPSSQHRHSLRLPEPAVPSDTPLPSPLSAFFSAASYSSSHDLKFSSDYTTFPSFCHFTFTILWEYSANNFI